MNDWPKRFRLVGAALLLIAFFLPVSSCTSQDSDDQSEASATTDGTVEITAKRYRYPYRLLAVDDVMTVPILVAFFWPASMVAYRKYRRDNVSLKIPILEILLCLLSIWIIWGMIFLYTPEIGSYVAFCGAILYLVAASVNIIEALRKRRHSDSHNQ